MSDSSFSAEVTDEALRVIRETVVREEMLAFVAEPANRAEILRRAEERMKGFASRLQKDASE